MKKVLLSVTLLLSSAGLVSCATWDQYTGWGSARSDRVYGENLPRTAPRPPETMVASSSPTGERGVSGSIGGMDTNDRTKLSHSLDKTPGKSTQWVNESTGVSYTVVPTRKVTINGNPYCRAYSLTASKGGKSRTIEGTACVSTDGSWQAMGG